MERDPYTLQCFKDVTMRRISEARGLLGIPKKWCDGAVTYALLASECALKATLLFGHQANDTSEVKKVREEMHRQVFSSKLGHDLVILWSYQHASIQSSATPVLKGAIDHLHGLDRFRHRYGAQRPVRKDAEVAVAQAETVVEWMRSVIT